MLAPKGPWNATSGPRAYVVQMYALVKQLIASTSTNVCFE